MSNILIITFSSCLIASDVVARPSALCGYKKDIYIKVIKKSKQKW
jgi:hypothetical protein